MVVQTPGLLPKTAALDRKLENPLVSLNQDHLGKSARRSAAQRTDPDRLDNIPTFA